MPPASSSRHRSFVLATENGDDHLHANSTPKILNRIAEDAPGIDSFSMLTPCKLRTIPVPNSIMDRPALEAALADAGLVFKSRHIDYFYEHLQRQNYPASLQEFVQQYKKILADHNLADTSISSDDDTVASIGSKVSHRHSIQYHAHHHRIPSKLLDFLEAPGNGFVTCTSRVMETTTTNNGNLIKIVIVLHDGLLVETAVMRYQEHGSYHCSVSVSCQVGCDVGCLGALCPIESTGFKGNLSGGEILEQVVHAQQVFSKQNPEVEPCHAVRKVSFMGSGEPLHNYAQVVSACKALSNKRVWNLRHGRITIGTVGIVEKIYTLTQDLPNVVIALGLHAPTQELRRAIVPVAEENPLDELMEALDNHMNLPSDRANGILTSPTTGSKRRMVILEYIMMEGKTSSLECAHQLGRLCEARAVIVNLIPYIADGDDTEDKRTCPKPAHIKEFQSIVASYGVICNVRIDVCCQGVSKIVARQMEYDRQKSLQDLPQDMQGLGFWQKLSFVRLCGWNRQALREREEKRRDLSVPREIFAPAPSTTTVKEAVVIESSSHDRHHAKEAKVQSIPIPEEGKGEKIGIKNYLHEHRWVLSATLATVGLCGALFLYKKRR